MKTKHILFLTSWYPTRNSPFAGDFVQRHARAASALNQITVLHASRNDAQAAHYEILQNQDIIKEITVYYKGSFFKPFNYFKRLIALYKGLKLVGNYDLIHLNVTYPAGVFALLLKFFKNKKYVITEHWTGFEKNKFKKINLIEQFLIKLILKNSEIILPVSNDLGKSMLEVAYGKKMEVIPNVVNTEIFTPAKTTNSSPVKKFLHLSSLKDDQKNISGMLNVAKRLANDGYSFEFHIGGNGDLTIVNRFIEKNQLHGIVIPVSSLPYEKVGNMMNQFDCFVLFSNYETQSCVRLESFSCGLPFIGTNIGGVNEFFPENFGILVEKGNEDELLDAMKSVIETKKFAKKEEMHQYAVDNFSVESISKKFNDIYEKVLRS